MTAKRLARDASLILVGSAAVYVVSFACSSNPSAPSPSGHADAGRDADGLLDVVREALSDVFDAAPDAVRDSMAQTSTSVTASCNVLVPNSTGSDNFVYAEASFPGRTVEELASATAVMQRDSAANGPMGYTHTSLSPAFFLKPAGIAVWCGMSSTGGVLNRSITFVVR